MNKLIKSIIFMIALLFIIGLGFLIYEFLLKIPNPIKKSDEVVQLNVNSNLVTTLYEKLGYYNNYLYKGSKVEVDSLTPEERWTFVFENISSKSVSIKNEECLNAKMKCLGKTYLFKDSVFLATAKSIFGENYLDIDNLKEVATTNFVSNLDFGMGNCLLENVQWKCQNIESPILPVTKKISLAYKEGTKLIIQDYYVYCNQDEKKLNRTLCYADSLKDRLALTRDLAVDELYFPTPDEIKAKGGKYQHTFELNNDGTYRWVQSEFIK